MAGLYQTGALLGIAMIDQRMSILDFHRRRSAGLAVLARSREAVCDEFSFSVRQGRATCRSVVQKEGLVERRALRNSAKQGAEKEAARIMALKFKLKTKDKIPAELVNPYEEFRGRRTHCHWP